MLGLRHYLDFAIDIWQGDITTFCCDVIVNASEPELTPGGGVSGAIHKAGGPRISEECRKIGGIKTGEAVFTSAGNLPAQFVIHTSGPIWRGGYHREQELLTHSYVNSLCLAESLKCRHITFPALSAGIYGYPLDDAALVAMQAVKQHVRGSYQSPLKRISFSLFDQRTYKAFQQALFEVFSEGDYE